jgi:hypothetical protein
VKPLTDHDNAAPPFGAGKIFEASHVLPDPISCAAVAANPLLKRES